MSGVRAEGGGGARATTLGSRLAGWFERLVRDPNPILVKELRATFRAKLFIRFLYLSTGLVGIVVLSVGAAVATGPLPPAEVGQIVFQMFFGTALFVIWLVGPAYASTVITAEHETRTYDSLILSGMEPSRIVHGKFLAAFGSMFLVLVAQAPVVGTAFLFGGVSPSFVVVGYAFLVLSLAVAIAFGVAISARLKSTRLAILVAILMSMFVFVPAIFSAGGFLTFLGEEAKSHWGTAMSGPFWFMEALPSRFFELDTFGTLFVLPIYLFTMPVWFLLASAVAAVRPAAEDRSTPFKVWSIVSSVGLVAMIALMVPIFTDGQAAGGFGLVMNMLGGFVLVFYALLFMNEPPLPPRLAEQRERRAPMRALFVVFGPGAAPTVRFATLLLVGTSVAMAMASIGSRHLFFGSYGENWRWDLPVLVVAVAHAAIAVFLLTFGAWLRTTLRSGIAARVLAIAAFVAMCILPFLFALIIDPDSFDRIDDRVPLPVHLSPVQPSIVGVQLADREIGAVEGLQVLIPTVLYGVLAFFFWTLIELRVRAVRREDDARRAAREERVRNSQAPVPILQRASQVPPEPKPSAAAGEGSDSEPGPKADPEPAAASGEAT